MSAEGPDKLVYMANQVATFFASQRGDAAAAQTADHLKAFWTPSMRAALFAHLEAHEGGGLSPVALAAARILQTGRPGAVRETLAAAGEPTARRPGNDAG